MRENDTLKVVDHRIVDITTLTNEVLKQRLLKAEDQLKELLLEQVEVHNIIMGCSRELSRRQHLEKEVK